MVGTGNNRARRRQGHGQGILVPCDPALRRRRDHVRRRPITPSPSRPFWTSTLSIRTCVVFYLSIVAMKSNTAADAITFEIITPREPSTASTSGTFPTVAPTSSTRGSSNIMNPTSMINGSNITFLDSSTEEYHNSSQNHSKSEEDVSSASPSSKSSIWQYQDDGHQMDYRDVLQAVLPMTFAFVSLVASYIMARESYVDARYKKPREATLPMQLLSMSVGYFIYSIGRMIGPLAGPNQVIDVWGTVGTVQTCVLQGFIIQFGYFSALIPNTILIWYIYVMVKYNWKDDKMRKYFYIINGSVWLTAFVVAIIQIPLDNYNFNGWVCWVKEFPVGCHEYEDDYEGNDEIVAVQQRQHSSSCIRGKSAQVVRLALAIGPGWSCALAVAVMFLSMWKQVRHLENLISRYNTHGNGGGEDHTARCSTTVTARSSTTTDRTSTSLTTYSTQRSIGSSTSAISPARRIKPAGIKSDDLVTINRKKSKAVAIQGMLYTGEYLGVFTFNTINVAVIAVSGSAPFALDLMAEILLSASALFNFLIFIRLRREMNTPEGRLIRRLACCCFPLLSSCSTSLQRQWERTRKSDTSSLPIDKTKILPQLARLSDEVYYHHDSTQTRSSTNSSVMIQSGRFSSSTVLEKGKQEATTPLETHSEEELEEDDDDEKEISLVELKYFDELDTVNDASLREIFDSGTNKEGGGSGNC